MSSLVNSIIAENNNQGIWYCFNDSIIIPTSLPEIMELYGNDSSTNNAYFNLLFYRYMLFYKNVKNNELESNEVVPELWNNIIQKKNNLLKKMEYF